MLPDGERTNEFYEGIESLPLRCAKKFSDEDYYDTEDEQHKAVDSCEEKDYIPDPSRELSQDHMILERRSVKDPWIMDLLRQRDRIKREPVKERAFEVSFTYAYNNIKGNRHTITRTEYGFCNGDKGSINDAQHKISSRLMDAFPNCEVDRVRPMREEW